MSSLYNSCWLVLLNHFTRPGDIVAAQGSGVRYEHRAASEPEQTLQWRLEVITPAHRQIETFPLQRHKPQSIAFNSRSDRETTISLAVEHRCRDIGLRS